MPTELVPILDVWISRIGQTIAKSPLYRWMILRAVVIHRLDTRRGCASARVTETQWVSAGSSERGNEAGHPPLLEGAMATRVRRQTGESCAERVEA